MKKLLAVVALAGMPGCCVAGATIGAATHPKEPEHSNGALAGFVIGAAIDVLTIVAVSQMMPAQNPGAAIGGSTD